METLLVVGGNGFIGQNFIKKAIEKKFKVINFSLKKSKIKNKNIKNIKVDISKYDKLNKVKINSKIDHVINLSGMIDHSAKIDKGIQLVENNFIGTLNLIKFVKNRKIKTFINIGSSDEYGNSKAPQNERQIENPLTYYSLSKNITNNFLKMINLKNKFPIIILRFFLVYGPTQNNQRLVPFVINSCLKNKKFYLTSGYQKRDFLFIDDAVESIFLAINNKKAIGKIINVSSGNPVSVRSIVNLILKKIQKGEPIFNSINSLKYENKSLYGNISRAKSILKWRPKFTLDDGLDITISFYKKIKDE